MSKRNSNDDGPRIVINVGDMAPEPNATLFAILRDGEKLKPGDARGTLLDRLGGELQTFFADQKRVAGYRHTPVKGTVTLTIAVTTGPDGSQGYTVESKTKGAKIPPGMSMTFTDDDGEVTGRPVEPPTELAHDRERKAKQNVSDAEPKVGAASNL